MIECKEYPVSLLLFTPMTNKNEQPITPSNTDALPQNEAPASTENITASGNETHIETTTLQGEKIIMSENTEAKNESIAVSSTAPASDTTAANSISASATPKEPNPDGGPTQNVKIDAQAAVQQLPTIADDEADGTEPIELKDIGNTTNDLQQDAIKAMAMKAEKDRLDREAAQVSAEQMLFDENMILRLDVVESGQQMILAVSGDLIVGRADNVTDYIPEIDLTPHGAYRFGLSRRHALIRRHEGSLLVKDLSSRNGTFVNGEQVNAGETHPLRDGDELRFGNLALRVNFQRKA
jgi:hypothetical protein